MRTAMNIVAWSGGILMFISLSIALVFGFLDLALDIQIKGKPLKICKVIGFGGFCLACFLLMIHMLLDAIKSF